MFGLWGSQKSNVATLGNVNVVRCPHPNKVLRCPPLPICSTHLEGTYVRCPPLSVQIFLCGVPPPCNSMSLPHLALSWILSKEENLASSNLQDEATDWLI